MKNGGKKLTGKSLKVPFESCAHKGLDGTLVKTRQFLVESEIDSASFLQLKIVLELFLFWGHFKSLLCDLWH